MKNLILGFTALVLLAALAACSAETTTTETSTVTTSAGTETVTTTETTITTTEDGAEQIKEGAKQVGRGLKEEARQAAAVAGAALERGGEELQKRAAEAAPENKAEAASKSGNAANGASVFQAKCASCHGADASGNTAMGKKNHIPDLRSSAVQGMTDVQLAAMIANGKPGGLSASAHKSKKLTPDQTQDVVAHLRSIRQ